MNRLTLAGAAAMAILRGKQVTPEQASLMSQLLPSGQTQPPVRGTAEMLAAYNTMPWLRAVTSKVAVAVASTNWRLYGTRRVSTGKFYRGYQLQRASSWRERRTLLLRAKQAGELVEVKEHPMLDLLHNANPYHVGMAARRILQVYLDLVGECFQLLERNRLGVPVAYWPLPPTWVTDLPTASQPFFTIKINTVEKRIPMSEVIWAQDVDPVNPYGRGSGLSRTLSDELETAEYASKHAKATFYNRARPDFVAWVKPGPNEAAPSATAMRRMQQQWVQEHQGFWRSFKPHFVNRELVIHEFEQDLKKQSLIELMQLERDTIIQVYGFPPEVFGILESSNRATIEAADYLFARYAVDPRLEFLRDVWQERLVPLYDERLILDYDSPVAEDKEYTLNVMKAQPGAFLADEWRVRAEMEELEEEQGKVFLLPLGVEPRSSLEPLDLTVEPPPADGDEEERSFTKDAAEDAYRLIHRIADKLEPAMRRAFLRAMNSMRAKISLNALQGALATGNVDSVVNSLPWDVLRDELGKSTAQHIRNILRSVGTVSAQRLSSLAGIDIGYDLTSPTSVQWLRNHADEFLGGIENVSREGIAAHVRRSFQQDISRETLARRIRQHVGLTEHQLRSVEVFEDRLIAQGVDPAVIERRVAKYAEAQMVRRARTIARTETIRVANAGQQLTWEQAVDEGLLKPSATSRVWLVTPDDRLDLEICEPMEGQRVGLTEPFKTGTGASVLHPPAHPLCRCAVVMELGGKAVRSVVEDLWTV